MNAKSDGNVPEEQLNIIPNAVHYCSLPCDHHRVSGQNEKKPPEVRPQVLVPGSIDQGNPFGAPMSDPHPHRHCAFFCACRVYLDVRVICYTMIERTEHELCLSH